MARQSINMNIPEKLIKFLEKNKYLLEKQKFDQIYANILEDLNDTDINNIGIMTYLFYKADFKPLEHMDAIPKYFLYNTDVTDLNISNFKIPNTIKSIGDSAFDNCKGITDIEIPNGVAICGAYAFSRCIDLTSVYIPSNIIIDHYNFMNCKKLKHVILNDNISYIGNYAFANCSSLSSIDFKGTKSQWNKMRKLKYWNFDSSIHAICCTDGNIYLK